MAREFSRWNVGANSDEDWKALPWPAQWLYKTLWDHAKLTYCGVLDWRPGRIAASAVGMDEAGVRVLAQCLEARLFVVLDEGTEEILIRSWARFDGLMRQPRMAVSFATAFHAVESPVIQGVLVHEVHKIRSREPNLIGWTRPTVADLLERTPLDPRTRDLPADPFGSGLPLGLGPASVPFGPNASEGLGHVWVPPTTATAPTPSPAPSASRPTSPDADAPGATPTSSRRKPERPLPSSWHPNDKHKEYADAHGLNIAREFETFTNHAATNDRRVRDWDAAFRTWLTKSTPATPAGKSPDVNAWMYR